MKLRVFFYLILLLASFYGKLWSQSDCSRCSDTLLRADLLSKKNFSELTLLKAEIYARHGFTFKSEKMTQYFSGFDWYKPLQRNVLIELNDIERKNVFLINTALNAEFDRAIRPDISPAKRFSKTEINRLFTLPVKKSLNIISDTICEVYPYEDHSGKRCLILSATPFSNLYNESEYIYNNSIRIDYCCVEDGRFFYTTNELTDLILTDYGEQDMRFLTQYTLTRDIDGDGLVDPIVVYATMGEGGYIDGWVKVVVNYKESLSTIYIANSPTIKESINVTSNFYTFPQTVRDTVKQLLLKIEEDGFLFLPEHWEAKMTK